MKTLFWGFDQEITFHLDGQEDGTVQELLPEVLKIQEGRGYGVIPRFYRELGQAERFWFQKLGGECPLHGKKRRYTGPGFY